MADKFIGKRGNLKSCVLIHVYVFFLVIFLCFIVSGCSLVKRNGKIQPKKTDIELGENAFFQENYRAAEMIFSMMIDMDTDPKRTNLARYNLACTRLAGSKTEQEMIEAMALFKEWHLSKQAGNRLENPLLLIPGIENIVELKERKQLESLKKNERMRAIVNDQKKTIGKLEQIIKTLKHQISELENIDQEIQEKRRNN